MASASSRGEMEKMRIDQLKALKEQADLEVNLLQDSLNNIRTATGRLDSAAAALNDLSLRPQGKKMLVPLTASLYVPGTLDEAHKVAAKKKSVADEAGMVLQAKVKQLTAATTS